MTKGIIENPFDHDTRPYEEWNDLMAYLNNKIPTDSLVGMAGKVLKVKADESGTYWGSSGGTGTDDYVDLSNKPKINSIELLGNKTAADLGLAAATDVSGKVDKNQTVSNKNKMLKVGTDGYVTCDFVRWGDIKGTLTDQSDLESSLSLKVDKMYSTVYAGKVLGIDAGGHVVPVTGGSGTQNYNDLVNKPSINSYELAGNVTLANIGALPRQYSSTDVGKVLTVNSTGAVTPQTFTPTVGFVNITGQPSDNVNLDTALKSKVDKSPTSINHVFGVDSSGRAYYEY